MTPALVEPRSFLVKTFVVGINMESGTYPGIFIVQLSHQNTKLELERTNVILKDGDDYKDDDVQLFESLVYAYGDGW